MDDVVDVKDSARLALIPLPGFVVWGFVIAAGAGIAFAAVASWKYVRTARANSGREPLDDPAWLRAYAFAFFVAVVGGSAISPVTIQGWHVVIALLAALIPVAFLVQHALDSTRRAWRVAALAFLVVQICVSLLVASGNTMFMGRLEPPIYDPAFPESVKPYVSHKGPRGTASRAAIPLIILGAHPPKQRGSHDKVTWSNRDGRSGHHPRRSSA